jgi:hypothetical protein
MVVFKLEWWQPTCGYGSIVAKTLWRHSSAWCLLYAWFTLQLWRWRWHVPANCLTRLHGVMSRKTQHFITTAVRTSNPTLIVLTFYIPTVKTGHKTILYRGLEMKVFTGTEYIGIVSPGLCVPLIPSGMFTKLISWWGKTRSPTRILEFSLWVKCI